jgi:serine/threonine protein kinase
MDNIMISFPNKSVSGSFDLAKIDLDKEKIVCKVGDFGLSVKLSEKRVAYSFVGTPQYMAPDILLKNKEDNDYSFKVDIWSLGVLFYYLITGKPIFDGTSMKELAA